MTNELTIIRHETTGSVLSVYRGQEHLGMVYFPVTGHLGHNDFQAWPTNERAVRSCATEADAIAYLAA